MTVPQDSPPGKSAGHEELSTTAADEDNKLYGWNNNKARKKVYKVPIRRSEAEIPSPTLAVDPHAYEPPAGSGSAPGPGGLTKALKRPPPSAPRARKSASASNNGDADPTLYPPPGPKRGRKPLHATAVPADTEELGAKTSNGLEARRERRAR